MTDRIHATIPLPPTVNHYYGRNGPRTYIKKQGKAYRHDIAVLMEQAGHRGAFGRAKIAVRIVVHMPTAAGDVDNRLKPLLDALEYAEVFDNDRQVMDLRITKGHPVSGGRCEVTIWRV